MATATPTYLSSLLVNSYLCVGVMQLCITIFNNRLFCLVFQHLGYFSISYSWQLMMMVYLLMMAQMNQVTRWVLLKIGWKYFKIPFPNILNMHARKICSTEKCKILVGKILTIQHPFIKSIRLFHCQGFALYGILCSYLLSALWWNGYSLCETT